MLTKIYQFPAQKKPRAEKDEEWGKKNVDVAATLIMSDTSKIRKTKANMKINYDLINGIIDETDIEKAFNPMNVKGVHFPAKIQNYPIELSKFNVLKGEETKRRFDWRVRSVNEDAISTKENEMKDQLMNLIISELSNNNYSEEQAARRLQQLKHYQEYEFQDLNEIMANRIISYFWYTQRLKERFSDAFYDVLTAAEEIYSVDAIHNEPIVSKKNPLNITTLGMGESHKIENSDIIVDDGYRSVGSVIDEFWDVLTSTEVTQLEEGGSMNKFAGDIVFAGPIDYAQDNVSYATSQLITVDSKVKFGFSGYFDTEGNVRVTRVVWRSRRKMGELKYYDEEGYEKKTFVDEKFPIKKELGMEVKWHWVNEWWQGYKIGPDIYVRIEPLPRIGSTMSNPSYCLPPYCGTIYSINSNEAISLMDRVKPYKYLYNVYMRRTELASARNKGVLAELDLAEIPDGWDEELVMMYSEMSGYMIKDSFKEGKKGAATGKLVASIKQKKSEAINLSSANVIRENLELARYVKLELGEIAGVTPQREGQISNRETLGGVEMSVSKSLHITEEWFRLHDSSKLRVLELVLETGKHCWRDFTGESTKKLQYVDDGLITNMFLVDGKIFAESEYGIYISDSSNDAALVQAIKTLAHAAIQNDKATLTDVINIYRDTSISSMAKKLETSEKESIARDDQARREALESAEKVQQSMVQFEQMKMDQEYKIAMRKIEAEIMLKEMELTAKLKVEVFNKEDYDKDGKEVEKLKLQLEQKQKELQEKSKQFREKLNQDKELKLKALASTEKIASMKT